MSRAPDTPESKTVSSERKAATMSIKSIAQGIHKKRVVREQRARKAE